MNFSAENIEFLEFVTIVEIHEASSKISICFAVEFSMINLFARFVG